MLNGRLPYRISKPSQKKNIIHFYGFFYEEKEETLMCRPRPSVCDLVSVT